MEKRIITAESVTSGHPDKLADLIADTILDKHLEQDPKARVACEVLLSGKNVFVVGEFTSTAKIDYEQTIKEVIAKVGYETKDLVITTDIKVQSEDISGAVTRENDTLGAGDQGVVFGYASPETESLMPLPIHLAHKLTNRLTECREQGIIAGLLPDGKSLVSVEYSETAKPRVVSIVLSTQHTEDKDIGELRMELYNQVIREIFSREDLEYCDIWLNPSGRFVLGGFEADSGLTGRKLMVDSYGGSCKHGGGAFSGKDSTKVDRSGAYMARYVAKNIVASGLVEQCEISLSYAIGKREPTTIDINAFYTNAVSEQHIKKTIEKVFDFRVDKVIEHLELRKPIFSQTAVGGHFGKENLPWERVDKLEEIKKAILEIANGY